MFSQTGGHMAVSGLPAWHILFAREPEEDVEVDETEEDPASFEGDEQPEPEGGGRRKLMMLALLAVLAGGGLYLASDPDMIMTLMGGSPDPAPVITPPAKRPAPPQPPAASPEAAARPPLPEGGPAGAVPAAPPKPAAPPAPGMPPAGNVASSGPAASPAPMPKPPAPPASGASPLFAEGQAILVMTDPAKPAGPVVLMADAEGKRPGPAVAPNTMATVVDGERHSNAWIYAVRTAQGATGWIAEKQLKAATP